MSVTFRGGKLPPEPSRPRLKLGPFLDVARVQTQHPAMRDWLTSAGPFPMDGNDRYGDCVFADQAHEIQAFTAYATGNRTVLTQQQVLEQYALVTGFDPRDPDTDQGAVIQDALDAWRKQGFAGHRIAVFAQVDHTSIDEVSAAIDLFGAVSVGCVVTQAAMDQFNAGQSWKVVSSPGPELGGHAVHAGWYDRRPAEPTIEVVTWGQVQPVSWSWWTRYVDECWVKIPQVDWFGPQGQSPSGLDLHGLGEAFARLTGGANPFPGPTPAPDPAEAATAADRALWALVEPWVMSSGRRWCGGRQARALLAWATAKGLHPGGS